MVANRRRWLVLLVFTLATTSASLGVSEFARASGNPTGGAAAERGSADTTTTTNAEASTTSTTSVATTTTFPKIVGHTISVPVGPDAFVKAGDDLWVASCGGNAVTEVNIRSKRIVKELNAPAYGFNCPDALAFDGIHIWVANKLGSSITELETSTGNWVQTLSGPQILNPDALAFDGTNIWVADSSLSGHDASFMSEFDASSGSLVRALHQTKETEWTLLAPSCIAIGRGRVWVSDIGNNVATAFNMATGAYVGETRGGAANPSGIDCVTYHSGYIWISGSNNGVVVEYNAATGLFARYLKGDLNPNQLVFTGNYLFVVGDSSDSVAEYNSRGIFVRTVTKESQHTYEGIRAILFDGKNLWVGNYQSNSISFFRITR